MLHMRCPYDYAWLVIFGQDSHGVFRAFVKHHAPIAGIVAPPPAHQPLHEWLASLGQAVLPATAEPHRLEVRDDFTRSTALSTRELGQPPPAVPSAASIKVQVYMATYPQRLDLSAEWINLPTLIRQCHNRQTHKMYLLMWQILMSHHNDSTYKVIVK